MKVTRHSPQYILTDLGIVCRFNYYWMPSKQMKGHPSLGDLSKNILRGWSLHDQADQSHDPADLSHDQTDQSCEVMYIHQVGSSVMPFMAEQFLGMSDLIHKLYICVTSFSTHSFMY